MKNMGGTRLTNIVQRRVIFYPERIRTGLFIIRKHILKISVVIIQSELSIQNQKKILGINILNII